ncbi:MAG: class I SAM-dependent methyltransferase [Desertimonas sp.]
MATPGAQLDPAKMPGHWLLARLGKRVLRPGGRATTDWLLDQLRIAGDDDVVELAPGLGATAALIIARSPASYTGVERDPDAVAAVSALLRPGSDRCVAATAQHTTLDDESADVVFGEAFLTMQSDEHKAQMISEAFRVLRPGGRYGLHELMLRPDQLDDNAQSEVRRDLARAIHVGARPLTIGDWRSLLAAAGFEVHQESSVGMLLLEPGRLIEDEGWTGAGRVLVNVLRSRTARRRVRSMRATFRRHREHLGAVALVAVKPAATPRP